MSVSVIMDRILPTDWCGRQSPLVDWPLMGGDFGSEGKIEICRPDTGITPARPAVLLTENGLWSVDPDFSPHFRSLGVSVAAFNTKSPIPSRKSANKGHQSDRYERDKQICLADIAAEQYAGNGVDMSTSGTMP